MSSKNVGNLEQMETLFCELDKHFISHDLAEWQADVLFDAIYYEFILKSKLIDAILVVKEFESMELLYEKCKDSSDEIRKKIALATQI